MGTTFTPGESDFGKADAVVIGGGIVGVAMAFRLSGARFPRAATISYKRWSEATTTNSRFSIFNFKRIETELFAVAQVSCQKKPELVDHTHCIRPFAQRGGRAKVQAGLGKLGSGMK